VANFIIFWWLCSGCSASKQTLTSARLDVHELAHEGKLKLGSHGWLFGAICFEVTGGPDARQLVLEFPRKSASGEPLAFTADDCLLLAERQLWRAIPHVHLRRMQPPSARSVCLVERQHLVFLLPQMRCDHLSVHNGPSLGPLGALRREVARSAQMGCERHYPDQAARYA
jgi:hypothetical protein